jgi:hypothetical protein
LFFFSFFFSFRNRLTATAMLVLLFIVQTVLGVPLAISPLIIVVLGIAIAYYDEKVLPPPFPFIALFLPPLPLPPSPSTLPSFHSSCLLPFPPFLLTYFSQVQRAEFFMRFHRDEVIAYVRAKEQYESPATISISVR